MTKKETKREGFYTAKDREHGLFGKDKSTHKDVLGKLDMGAPLFTEKDKKRGLM
jgi:hypothetical protein